MRRLAFVLALCALAAGCDQDPFGVAYRPIRGPYQLEEFEGGVYYIQAHGAGNPMGVGGGAVDRIGWDRRYIVARHGPAADAADEWVIIDTETGAIAGPLTAPELARHAEVRGIRIRPAAEAWDDLPAAAFGVIPIALLFCVAVIGIGSMVILRGQPRSGGTRPA